MRHNREIVDSFLDVWLASTSDKISKLSVFGEVYEMSYEVGVVVAFIQGINYEDWWEN
jgi:hypothetical protein